MALHTYTFTTQQSHLLWEILTEEIHRHQDLYDSVCNDPKISQGDIDIIQEHLVMLKTMYSQLSKKL
jgi:hypothetical protein